MQNQSTGLMPKQKLKGFGYYTTGSGSATITFPSSFGNGANMQKGSSVIKPKNVNKHPISNNDPYYDLKTKKFAHAIVNALDKVEEFIAKVEEEPENYVQFYKNL